MDQRQVFDAGANKIDVVGFREKDMKKRNDSKIQTPEMKKDIERSRDISEAWLQGGKAVGEILKPKKTK
jgi:spermidine/putrescine-binding protein